MEKKYLVIGECKSQAGIVGSADLKLDAYRIKKQLQKNEKYSSICVMENSSEALDYAYSLVYKKMGRV